MTSHTVRRGLPRSPGGESWPHVMSAPADSNKTTPRQGAQSPGRSSVQSALSSEAAEVITVADATVVAESFPDGSGTSAPTGLRRGLPRSAGGNPWPDGALHSAGKKTIQVPSVPSELESTTLSTASLTVKEEQRPTPGAVETVRSVNGLRRGLPRGVGEDSWPPLTVTVTTRDEPDGSAFAIDATTVLDQQREAASESETTSTESVGTEVSTKPARLTPVGLFRRLPKVSRILLGVFAAVIIGGLAIIVARFVIDIPSVSQFVRAFPGITELPESAPIGLPAWLGWQHFFNVFFMVLIIRTGITIRREQRPTAYWAPRRDPGAKVSLTVWLHQSLDVLWLVNGVVFVVLLFATGQWMRIVPTSWEVFPNAISAALQYVTLDWPTENGWVNYNSLQVLAYFTTVFIASPLAAITGFRMSGMWPTKARRLNALYPMEWARAIHFPVMIYFCGFIAIHVFLVFTTGALKNLNHIYTGRDVVDWLGFWVFAATLAVVAAAWAALRPLFMAPIARLFGPVTSR